MKQTHSSEHGDSNWTLQLYFLKVQSEKFQILHINKRPLSGIKMYPLALHRRRSVSCSRMVTQRSILQNKTKKQKKKGDLNRKLTHHIGKTVFLFYEMSRRRIECWRLSVRPNTMQGSVCHLSFFAWAHTRAPLLMHLFCSPNMVRLLYSG